MTTAATANAQVVIYRSCAVSDGSSLIAALTAFYDSISGVAKPAATLYSDIFNGDSPTTHVLVEDFTSYEALEAWRNRVAQSPAALLQLGASANSAASCQSEGLALEVGFWGDRDAVTDYHFVFPISTTDAARYAAAFAQLAEDLDSPGPTGLYVNRSGVPDTTHFVVQWGPSLAALNHWADE
ncbi:MAG TPA: hypothetical protein VKQ06_13410, partial [Gammaproteobacteria bacterium]|nr:hypothetical protein [Gammaproteobacteria bacterium]